MFPKKGNNVPLTRKAAADQFAHSIGKALRDELGSSNRATKTVMKWTGASDRSAKNWIGGSRAPGGWHLILLARHSDAVLAAILLLAQRDQLIPGAGLRALQIELLKTADIIDDVFGGRSAS